MRQKPRGGPENGPARGFKRKGGTPSIDKQGCFALSLVASSVVYFVRLLVLALARPVPRLGGCPAHSPKGCFHIGFLRGLPRFEGFQLTARRAAFAMAA